MEPVISFLRIGLILH